jgi:hypothetical protein
MGAFVNDLFLRALELACGLDPTPNSIEAVSAGTTAEAARWAFGQWELRTRASAKFVRAAEMLFDRSGLEMASHERIAAYRGTRFPKDALVADLTCGIGADSIGLAARGPTVSFDLSPERVTIANWNLRVYGFSESATVSDAKDSMSRAQYVVLDPARRSPKGARVSPAEFSPNPWELADQLAEKRLAAMKLGPGVSDDLLRKLGPGVEFWSFGGECREACVWTGIEADPFIGAVHVETGERLPRLPVGEFVMSPRRYLMDADPAAVRADALGNFGLAGLGSSHGYLTGDELRPCAWLRCYEVLGDSKGDLKSLKGVLRELRASAFEVKSRSSVDGARLLRELGPTDRGLLPVSVVAYQVGKSVRFALAKLADS